jgi:hypothetical protein
MKKLSVEELAQHAEVTGATKEEAEQAVAVIHSLLSNSKNATTPTKSAWQRGRTGLRQQLSTTWERQLRS